MQQTNGNNLELMKKTFRQGNQIRLWAGNVACKTDNRSNIGNWTALVSFRTNCTDYIRRCWRIGPAVVAAAKIRAGPFVEACSGPFVVTAADNSASS